VNNAEHPPPWPIQAAGASERGRVRRQNEDRYLIDLTHNLFMVSDEMGGHLAGELAATAVITVLPLLIEQQMRQSHLSSTGAIEQALREAMIELSQRLHDESTGWVDLRGMGATIALAWLRGSLVHLAHLGDSRIYLFRQERFTQLTEDHSIIALLLRYGEIAPEQA
jgi:serine/threonine protein phosphatase PrpC